MPINYEKTKKSSELTGFTFITNLFLPVYALIYKNLEYIWRGKKESEVQSISDSSSPIIINIYNGKFVTIYKGLKESKK